MQIKSVIAANASNVKSIIDNAFKDVMPQRVLTVTAPEQVRSALAAVREFLGQRRESSQVVFLILDLFLLPAELGDLDRKALDDPALPLTWRPDTAKLQELLCSYGEVEEGVEPHVGKKCLWSLRILHSLWRFLDPSVIVVFNVGSIRITGHDLARISATLVNKEGVAWLYSKQDEDAGECFVNYLRVLRERAERTLPRPDVHAGVLRG